MQLRTFTILIICLVTTRAFAQTAPLVQIEDLVYEGAVRLPASTYNNSSLNYAQGPIAFNPASSSILIVGHAQDQQIAEFALPSLVQSQQLSDLNMAAPPMQGFSAVLNRMSNGNPQNLNRIGGLHLLETGAGMRLFINAFEYYDAPGDNTHTSLQVGNPGAIDSSEVLGPLAFEGGAGHTSGWISEISSEWRSALGGDHITGQSSGIPIISRTSVGPSAFAFTAASINDATETINTVKLLDFSLANPLHEDLDNAGGTNKLWTHLSRAVFGMVVPGTSTYLTIGYSGGHKSGVCYKCVQDTGNLCGGYCPRQAADSGSYYWLWDLQDLVAVRNGVMESYEVRPYAFGPWQTPFPDGEIGGASYDSSKGMLYVSLPGADREQGTYSNPPVIIAYSIAPPVFRDGFE